MSSFFQKSGSTSTVENTIQTDVDAAAASAAAAQAAQAASETAKAGSETAKTASETAQTLSETARDASITAQLASQAARDTTLGYRNTAETHKDAAASSASAASASETASQTAQAAAEAAEANAATSEANAASSASSASSSQAAAASSASSTASDAVSTAADVVTTNADVVLTNADAASTAADRTAVASDKATVAADKAIVNTDKLAAAASASAAASSASTASSAQTAAEAARDSALAAYDNFDDRYLGTFTNATEPTVDNDGDALVAGSLYYNSDAGAIKLYNGTAWVAAYISGTGFAALNGATFTGNVTVPNLITSGTVDGRDVATDGTKLDGIATNAIANVVEDTTPQLGGNLDTNGNDISFGNNNKAIFGNAFEIFHDGFNTYLAESGGTGNVYLRANNLVLLNNSNETYVNCISDGAVTLYHNNAVKLATTATGVEILGNAKFTGTGRIIQFDKNGSGEDNAIYYDNTTANNNLFIGRDSSNIAFRTGGSERMRLNQSGQLGVGTSSPNKSSSSTALTVNTSSAANYSALELSSGNTLNWHINANNAAVYDVTAGTRPRVFYTNGSERMRIDSSGRVGISTTALSSTFQVGNGSADTRGTFNPNTAFAIGLKNGSNHGGFIGSGGANVIQFSSSAGAERMRIDSGGLVQINTTSGNERLNVHGAIGASAASAAFGGGLERALMDYTGSVVRFGHVNGASGSAKPVTFLVAGAEKARLDASGNLLVGKTALGGSTDGLQVKPAGELAVTRDGNHSLILNRKSSDGNIALFQKDSTTVGSIGTGTTEADFIVGRDDTFLGFRSGADDIIPHGGASRRDNAIDLGDPSYRFKDAHFSGTVNATTVDLGNWTITESAGVLYFATGGTNKMKIDASGNLTVVGDVTAFGSV